jgi:hypothetical protein
VLVATICLTVCPGQLAGGSASHGISAGQQAQSLLVWEALLVLQAHVVKGTPTSATDTLPHLLTCLLLLQEPGSGTANLWDTCDLVVHFPLEVRWGAGRAGTLKLSG